MIELFTVPAGTKITQAPNGLLVFNPPDAYPFTVKIVIDGARTIVVKTEIAPDCDCEITIGTA